MLFILHQVTIFQRSKKDDAKIHSKKVYQPYLKFT